MKIKQLLIIALLSVFAVSTYAQKAPTKGEQAIMMMVKDNKITQEQADKVIALIQEQNKKSFAEKKNGADQAALTAIYKEYGAKIQTIIGKPMYTEWVKLANELRK